MNIGVFGGTFDPIHNGHLGVIEEARTQLRLDEVIFVPAGWPWLKSESPISAVEHRVEMVRLAIENKPCCKLSTIEADKAGRSYTVDTIAEIKGQLGAELFFILGWDAMARLPEWKEPSRLIEMCRLVAVPRPSHVVPDLKEPEAIVAGLSRRTVFMDKPHIDVSATEIRRRVAQNQSVSHLVPEPVDNYIEEHNLYKSTGGIA
jgi:nicotinate-nucleotide adenylyltransferase